ncbi:MAG: BapA prefix-like domain-containing protein, partial [Burkholderiaceae bacterium]|nr:BapA prefix-like domain-containing protein [Burkholderiaceae bacterium]
MALEITVTSKATHVTTVVTGPQITLSALSVVELPIAHTQIKSLARHGNDLLITTLDGQVIVVHGFFADDQAGHNDLVFQDDGGLWQPDWADLNTLPDGGSAIFDPAALPDGESAPLDAIDPLLDSAASTVPADASAGDVGLDWLPLAIATTGFATALGARGSGGVNNTDTDTTVNPPLKPPSGATLTPNPDGTLTVSGTGTPGDQVKVVFPDGSFQIANVQPDGTYSATSSTPQNIGDVTLTTLDSSGHQSDPSTLHYT